MIVRARGPVEATLNDMLSLMRMLLREERSAYDTAMAAAVEADGLVDPLAAMHHAATFQQHVCKLIELLLGAPQSRKQGATSACQSCTAMFAGYESSMFRGADPSGCKASVRACRRITTI